MYWKSDVIEWDKIPLDAYRFIFEQTKDRYTELIAESETITNKTFSILLVYIAGVSAALGFLLSKDANVSIVVKGILILSIGLTIPALYLCFKLVEPRTTYYKGNTPKQLFREDAFKGYTPDESVTGLYYNELIVYQKRIDFIENQNEDRIEYYNILRWISLGVLFLTVLVIVLSI